jgi:hypothetical protein
MSGPPPYIIPPAGVTAASFFVPFAVVDPALPPAILADKLTATGDLASFFVGGDPIDEAIAFQLRIVRGTGAAVVDDGQRFRDIKKNDNNAVADIRSESLRVLQPFIANGDIADVSLQIQAGEDEGDLGAVFIVYRNLRSGQQRKPQVF